ncbi:unnamed protein product, partial [Aureobasidium pullulans]
GSAPCSSDIKNCPNNCVFEALSSLLTLWRAGMMASILTCQQYYRDAAEDMWYSMCRMWPANTTGSNEHILMDRYRRFLDARKGRYSRRSIWELVQS